jgi:hypothetical protein
MVALNFRRQALRRKKKNRGRATTEQDMRSHVPALARTTINQHIFTNPTHVPMGDC